MSKIGLRLAVIGVLFLIVMGVLAIFAQARWWLALAIAVVIHFGFGFVLQQVAYRLFKMPFQAKGAVLKNAQVHIHKVIATTTPPPDEDNEDEEVDDPNFSYYRVDLTIIPEDPTGNFTHWEPGDLLLVPTTLDLDFHDDCDDYIRIRDIKIYDGEKLLPDDGYKLQGKQHLRMLVGAKPDIQQAKFRYYFEEFGEVSLAAT